MSKGADLCSATVFDSPLRLFKSLLFSISVNRSSYYLNRDTYLQSDPRGDDRIFIYDYTPKHPLTQYAYIF